MLCITLREYLPSRRTEQWTQSRTADWTGSALVPTLVSSVWIHLYVYRCITACDQRPHAKNCAHLKSCFVLVSNADEVRHSSHVVLHASTQRYRNLLTAAVHQLSAWHVYRRLPAHHRQQQRGRVEQSCRHCALSSLSSATFSTHTQRDYSSTSRLVDAKYRYH